METCISSEKRWIIENALKSFPYLDTWSKKTVDDCCRMGNIKIIAPGQIVLGPEDKESSKVHFIIEGTCKLIQHLSLKPKRSNAAAQFKAFYDNKIYNHANAKDGPNYSSFLFTKKMENEAILGESKKFENGRNKEINLGDFPHPCEMESSHELLTNNEETDEKASASAAATILLNMNNLENGSHERVVAPDVNVNENQISMGNGKICGKFSKLYVRSVPDHLVKNQNVTEKSEKFRGHFLQIALLHKGSCLGFGENLQNRFLLSVTEVTCLVIPLQFLLQHNPSNIWNRIKHFLTRYLPSEDKIFSEFVINRRWSDEKRKISSGNYVMCKADVKDVPVSIRLNDVYQKGSGIVKK